MNPDSIIKKYLNKKVKLFISANQEDDIILIEGNKESLQFLGELLLTHAEDNNDCGYQLLNNGAGRKMFHSDSQFGIYIHRLPCQHKK